mmetsp:Transcript_89104/g.277023  ORF Transcript_89104/g.277023 Transcript_89104/m.277023 type:complete len:92 (-) Transcript_89104:14-289(-)
MPWDRRRAPAKSVSPRLLRLWDSRVALLACASNSGSKYTARHGSLDPGEARRQARRHANGAPGGGPFQALCIATNQPLRHSGPPSAQGLER